MRSASDDFAAQQGQHVLQARFEHGRAGDRAALADPQPGQAEHGSGHGLRLAGQLGQLIGAVEALPAGQQVARISQRALAVGEARSQFIGQAGGQFQPTSGRAPSATLVMHKMY